MVDVQELLFVLVQICLLFVDVFDGVLFNLFGDFYFKLYIMGVFGKGNGDVLIIICDFFFLM